MYNFRNIIYSDTPPNINSLWLKGTTNPEDPFEIRIFKNGRWEIVDRGGTDVQLEGSTGNSTTATMTQQAITKELDEIRKSIENINTNKVSIKYLPIENTGESQYNITLQVEKTGNVSDIQFCSDRECFDIKEGDNPIQVDITKTYTYKYVSEGITIENTIQFKTTNPIYFGISDQDITTLNQEILNTLNKKVLEQYEEFYYEYQNEYQDSYFYVIIPNNKKMYLTSNGFYIPMQVHKQVSYLGTIYNIHKSGLLEEGPLNNINIKII